jgi:hypothetical protein
MRGLDWVGPDEQERGCRNWATAIGYRTDNRHVHRDVSIGSKYREPPMLTQLRAVARACETDGYVVMNVYQLGRNQTDVAILWEESKHYGFTLAFMYTPKSALR